MGAGAELPASLTAREWIRREAHITYHRFRVWLRSGWSGSKVVMIGLYAGLMGIPVFVGGWKHGVLYSVAWVLFHLLRAQRELAPENMQVIATNYVERKLRLYRLVEPLMGPLSWPPTQIRTYQEEVLALVANYVRNHRADFTRREIFVSVLVPDGDDMVVVVRDPDHRRRPTSSRMPKKHSLAWRAIEEREAMVTGDVYADFPETPGRKPYQSILAIPVFWKDRPVGVVTIDSPQKYRFDREGRELTDYVAPYIALLGWTLAPNRGTVLAYAPTQGGSV